MLKTITRKSWKLTIDREKIPPKLVVDDEEISQQLQSETTLQAPIVKKEKKPPILGKLLKSLNG